MPDDFDWLREWMLEPARDLFRTLMTVSLVGLKSTSESGEWSDSDEVFVLAGAVWNPAAGGYGLHGLHQPTTWNEVDVGDHVQLDRVVYQGAPQDIVLVAYVGEDDAGYTVSSGGAGRNSRTKAWGYTQPYGGNFWAVLSSAVLRYQSTLDLWDTEKYVKHQLASTVFPNDDRVVVIVEPLSVKDLRSIAADEAVDFYRDGALVPSGRWRRRILANSWGYEEGGYLLFFDVTFDRVLI